MVPCNAFKQKDSAMKHKATWLSTHGMGVSPMVRNRRHGRCANATLGILFMLSFPLIFVSAGCHEPPDYRTEVVGNGEGGVEVHRVPKDPSEMNAQQEQSPPSATKSPLEQRVEVLEATVLRQQEEIATLHRELNAKIPATTAP